MNSVLPETIPRGESVLKPALLLMSGRTLSFAATFFIPIVLARTLEPSQFGTYKQLFLIYSSVYLLAQGGMASSLYYFLPHAADNAGSYVSNSLYFLGTAGLVAFGALVLLRPKLAQWMSNVELSRYVFWIALYIFLMMVSATLEIVLISRGRFLWASASYASSDLARAAASIIPVLLFRRLDPLLHGLLLVASLRVAIALGYFRAEFRGALHFDRSALKNQLAYTLPFGLAILVEIVQQSLPQYVVAHLTTPATFATFAVGCLSVPLVDFAASPASDVMMVKMQQHLVAGRAHAVLGIWYDTTLKLALLFFPLMALLIVGAREIIVLLFTTTYTASVPIFAVWSLTILLTTFQLDGVLRVFAQTRLLLALNLMRLAIIGGLIKWSLSTFSLVGPVLVIVLATLAFKAGALIRMTSLLQVRASELLPWRKLAAVLAASAGAGAVGFAVKSVMGVPILLLVISMTAAHTVTYALLVWHFDLLSAHERLVILEWIRRPVESFDRVSAFRKE